MSVILETQRKRNISSCSAPTDRIDGGREKTAVDVMYGKLQSLGVKAACDQQYDPPVEEYITYRGIMTPTGRFRGSSSISFVTVMLLGLAAISFWRSVR
jgi:hypothetical protein